MFCVTVGWQCPRRGFTAAELPPRVTLEEKPELAPDQNGYPAGNPWDLLLDGSSCLTQRVLREPGPRLWLRVLRFPGLWVINMVNSLAGQRVPTLQEKKKKTPTKRKTRGGGTITKKRMLSNSLNFFWARWNREWIRKPPPPRPPGCISLHRESSLAPKEQNLLRGEGSARVRECDWIFNVL